MSINLQRFDLTTLRLLVAAVHVGSLTAGAERLGLSLAAASKRIAELEAHVGTPLLARSKRGVRPTAAGQVLLPHAVEMVARLEQLALAMDGLGAGTAGHLRLWANTSAFGGFLPALLARFARAHPAVVLDLEDAISDEVVRAVARGAAELGVIGENTPDEGLHTQVCNVDDLVLLLPPGHALVPAAGGPPVPLATVLEHDLVAFARPTSLTRQLAASAERLQRPLRIRAQVRSFDAMGRMVAHGLGLAVLPRAGAEPYASALGLVMAPLSGLRTRRCLLWAMRDPERLSPAAQALVQMAGPPG
ncbi:LysR family transcriptional regulator [Rubrivivax sp. RP6-9]|uniref:LysR family transcriptional regulator n=1 Tax=Rubrivivax sp. RP6-9 TaxID=3415750 RepID=UPI003CC64540